MLKLAQPDDFIHFNVESHRMLRSVNCYSNRIDGLIRVNSVHRLANAMGQGASATVAFAIGPQR